MDEIIMSIQQPKELETPEIGFTQVWHLREEYYPPKRDQECNLQWPDDYEFVALMHTEDLIAAFRWGNDPDGWFRDEVVIMCEPRDLRSTSVSDVFVTPSGAIYIVERLGLRLIDYVG